MPNLWLLIAVGCGRGGDELPERGLLTPTEHALRASMAIRGIRPSLAEIEAVRRSPDALPGLVDTWLDDPAFGETVREMMDEIWLLDSGVAQIPVNGPLTGFDPRYIRSSLAEASARLVEHVVTNDRPFTEIVTAEYTMANPVVALAWQGIGAYDPDGPEWQVTTWEDGRPLAGILSDSYLYVAYRSAGANYNRGRANTISRSLLCRDFLAADPIPDTSVDLSDPDVVSNAVVENPNCAGCHHDLDPLGSFLVFRPYPVLLEEVFPIWMYNRGYLGAWEDTTGRAPAYFGEPADDLTDLGRLIAADPAFAECTSRRFASFLGQVPLEAVDPQRVEALSDGFVRSGYLAKSLVRDIVLSDAFRSSAEIHTARPGQLGRLFEDLTGFRWSAEVELSCCDARTGAASYGHVPDLLSDTYVGYRVLAGGVDAPHVALPSHAINPTYHLVLRTVAELAAAEVVERELRSGGERLLLHHVDADTREEGPIREQLASLHQRLYGEIVGPDHAEVDRDWALFQAALGHGGSVETAWRIVLTAMLQDIRIATY